jgi:alcohol dehydrogenase class IV
MLMASNMAAIAFNVAGLGICHGMGHPLSARLNLAHGQTLATMLPHAMRFNLDVARAKYARAALALGVGDAKAPDADNANAAIEAVIALRARVETHKTLRQLGATEDQLAQLAEDALGDLVTMANPRRVAAPDVIAMYTAALD